MFIPLISANATKILEHNVDLYLSGGIDNVEQNLKMKSLFTIITQIKNPISEEEKAYAQGAASGSLFNKLIKKELGSHVGTFKIFLTLNCYHLIFITSAY